jgi:carbonic anhydrase
MKFFNILLIAAYLPILFIEGLEKFPSQKVIEELMSGNQRALDNNTIHKNYLEESRLIGLSKGQLPKAIIVTCSDSRVPPEIIFDQGLGDLFVVRIAGNVVADVELESIKYAAFHLKAPLILVLGHENCGAVNAVLKDNIQDIPVIAKKIKNAFTFGKVNKKDSLKKATEVNVSYVVKEILNADFIKTLKSKNYIDVKGAYFQISNGKVYLLD